MRKEGYTLEARVRRQFDMESSIEEVFETGFFERIKKTPLSREAWRRFVLQKYGSISYFLAFLKNGQRLSESISPEIASVFEENYRDEIGHFAGATRPEYGHETWRVRSLRHFGVSQKDLAEVVLLPEVEAAQEINRTLVESENFFEVVGALLYWEPFVVREMQQLILAFERDMPDLFPREGYDYTRFPHNEQEYWYSHAAHDVWHFRQIREALQSYFDEHELSEADITAMQRGMQKVQTAKALLYSNAVFDAIKNT